MATEQEHEAARARIKATREFKTFLESSPAYRERRIANLLINLTPYASSATKGVPGPRISLYCETCDGFRDFDGDPIPCVEGDAVIAHSTCRNCGTWRKTFALILQADKQIGGTAVLMKLGEYPPFGSHLAKRLQDMLSEPDLALYRKGLRTEREGHGIGAAAYFRRVVENQWKDLVTRLREAAEKLGTPKDKLKVFDDALNQQQFSNAVDLLKDAIPPKLLILDGRNPLTLLYKPLSEQIHSLSDEECLQQAADIRLVLNELFDNISRVLKADDDLKGAVTRLQGPS